MTPEEVKRIFDKKPVDGGKQEDGKELVCGTPEECRAAVDGADVPEYEVTCDERPFNCSACGKAVGVIDRETEKCMACTINEDKAEFARMKKEGGVVEMRPGDAPNAETPVEPIAAIPKPVGLAAGVFGAVPRGQWKLVAAGQVVPREDNPRRIDERSRSFQELVASITAAGIITPLLGRPHPELPGCVELLAGHRRRAAGLQAGLTEFPVVVREMDDRTAVEVLVFENLDRENLTPLEEARGVDLLLRSKHEAAEIAGRMGKSVPWVMRRRQLLHLTKGWKDWAEEKAVSAAHLELIARLPAETQEDLFEQLTENWADEYFFGPGTLTALRDFLAETLLDLKGAPWGLDDATLVAKAGACAGCPKRSGCQLDLFNEPEDAGDRCLDRECWEGKRVAYMVRRVAEAKKEHKGLRLVRGSSAWDPWIPEMEKELGRLLQSWEFKECKESAQGAVRALIVTGQGAGSLTWIQTGVSGGTREQVAKKTGESKAGVRARASLDPEASAKLLAEESAELEKRRWVRVQEKLEELLENSEMPGAEELRTVEGMLRVVEMFGAAAAVHEGKESWAVLWETAGGRTGVETLRSVWAGVKENAFFYVPAKDQGTEKHIWDLRGLAWALGASLDVIKEQVDAEIAEPKHFEQLRKLAEAPPPEAKKTAKKEAKPKAAPKKKTVKKGGE